MVVNQMCACVKAKNKGFTLVELIIVITIIAIIVGIITPQFMGYVKQAQKAVDARNAREIAQVIQMSLAGAKTTDAEVYEFSVTPVHIGRIGYMDVIGWDSHWTNFRPPRISYVSGKAFGSTDAMAWQYSLTSDGKISVGIYDGSKTWPIYPDILGNASLATIEAQKDPDNIKANPWY